MVGPPFRVAVRLYAVAITRWAELDAAYITIDLIHLPLDRMLNCVYAWCLERVPEDKSEEWLFQLAAPLPGEKITDEPADWDEDDSFMTAMQTLRG